MAFQKRQSTACCFKVAAMGTVWWYIPVILAFGRLRQADYKFKDSLSYRKTGSQKRNKQTQIFTHLLIGFSTSTCRQGCVGIAGPFAERKTEADGGYKAFTFPP